MSRRALITVAWSLLLAGTTARAALFSGDSYVRVLDPASGLSITNNNQFTIACWFKMTVPSGASITNDMTILTSGRDPQGLLDIFSGGFSCYDESLNCGPGTTGGHKGWSYEDYVENTGRTDLPSNSLTDKDYGRHDMDYAYARSVGNTGVSLILQGVADLRLSKSLRTHVATRVAVSVMPVPPSLAEAKADAVRRISPNPVADTLAAEWMGKVQGPSKIAAGTSMIIAKTVVADSHAKIVNATQAVKATASTAKKVMTTTVVPAVRKAAERVASATTSIANSVSRAVSSAVKKVASIFGGGGTSGKASRTSSNSGSSSGRTGGGSSGGGGGSSGMPKNVFVIMPVVLVVWALRRRRVLPTVRGAMSLALLGGLFIGIVETKADVTQGLIARYELDGNANDSTTNGHAGAMYGGYAFAADRFTNSGSALHLGGVGYCGIPDSSDFRKYTNYSVATWFMTTRTTNDQTLLSKSTSDQGHCLFELRVKLNGLIYFRTYDTNAAYVAEGGAVSTGVWHHACAAVQGTNIVLYLDGRIVTNVSYTGLNPYGSLSYDGVTLGAFRYGPTNMFLWGALDDARIYSQALSSNDVWGLFNVAPAAPTSALAKTRSEDVLTLYRFEAGLADAVGNHFPLSGQASPGYQVGKLGLAIALSNASGQYAQSLVFTNADQTRTVDCWQYFASTSATVRYALTLSDGDQDNMLVLDRLNNDIRYRLILSASQLWNISATNLATGVWYHVVATCGSNGSALYVNGVLAGTNASTATPLAAMSQLRIGAKPNTPASFDGGIDNVALFSVPHNSNVVQYSYNSAKGIDFLAEKINGVISYSGLQTGMIYVLAEAGTAASWTNSLSTTGVYEFAQLVPYTNYNLTAWCDYTANGVRDSWEAQAAYVGNPAGLFVSNIPNASITITDPVFTVSGTVIYSGGQTGPVHATVSTDTEGAQILRRAVFPILPGLFTVTNVPGGGPFYIRAFMDSNGNGSSEPQEANGAWSGNPVVVTGSTSGIAISLDDLDSDLDGMPDWWEVRYGLNPTNETYFGDGSDGVFVVPSGTTQLVDSVKTAVAGTNAAGTNRLYVASTNGFLPNDTVLVIAMQDPSTDTNQNIAGLYEFRRINGTTNGQLILREPLTTSYSVTSSQKIQAIRVPEYSSVTVSGTLTCAAWDGTVGGGVAFKARQLLVATQAAVSVFGRGYRGGAAVPSATDYQWGIPGERTRGSDSSRASDSLARVEGGGGAGKGGDGSGGGGGYASPGTDGAKTIASSDYGRGAPAFGAPDLNRLFFGGGGGGSGSHSAGRVGVAGGSGGGILLIHAASILGSGTLVADGATGTTGIYAGGVDSSGAGGGGGAGGSILVVSRNLSSNLILSAAGGPGGLRHPSSTQSNNGGTGGVGRIRIDAPPFASLPAAFPGVAYTGATLLTTGDAGTDLDLDGLTALQEYQGGSNPTNGDSDYDGIPDLWEVTYGTNPTNANALADTDSDGLSNLLEFQLGSRPNTNDTDGDGLFDLDEYQTHGTSPNSLDSDGDGMPDAWEILHGLNPTIDDVNEDRDFDWVTNLQEFQNSLNPRSADTGFTGTNDYRRLNGGKSGARYTYDKIDRLTGATYEEGMSIAYVYDGNGNITRQVYLDFDQDDDGLLDLWELQNGLSYSNAAGGNGLAGDWDADGWSNFQEGQAGTSPTNAASYPDVLGRVGATAAVYIASFVPDRFVMGAGQLDDNTSEEIAISADGNPGTATNSIRILTQTNVGWTTNDVSVGAYGVTSITIGQPTNRSSAAVYLGLRDAFGSGLVAELSRLGTGWVFNAIATSTSAASVVAVDSGKTLLAVLSPAAGATNALYSLWPTSAAPNQAWQKGLLNALSTRTGTVTMSYASGSGAQPIRLLASTNIIQLGRDTASLWLNRPATPSWYHRTTNTMSWVAAESLAQGYGGHLVTMNDAVENDWVFSTFGSDVWIGLTDQNSERGSSRSGWTWASGELYSDIGRWLAGEPNNSADEDYVSLYSGGANWNDNQAAAVMPAIIERTGPPTNQPISIDEPLDGSRLTWSGPVFTAGDLRVNGGRSLFYAYVHDVNVNGVGDQDDEFVVAEYGLNPVRTNLTSFASIHLRNGWVGTAYGIAIADYLGAGSKVMFSGEPDGGVFAWIGAGSNSPLQRTLFSDHYAGRAWHQLSSCHALGLGEGVVGLLVVTNEPSRCSLIYWAPEIALWTPTQVRQNPPSTRILPSPNAGGRMAQVNIKIWDAEGNQAFPELQYQVPGQPTWSNAAVTSLDGMGYAFAMMVSAQPSGTVHQLAWNALTDLGQGYSNTVRVRARSRDLTMQGGWSEAVPFSINIAADGDGDGLPDDWESRYGISSVSTSGVNGASGDWDNDGASNWDEFLADTNPTNSLSRLRVTGIGRIGASTLVNWIGGSSVWQYVEFGELTQTGVIWSKVFTNLPPTDATESILDTGRTNKQGWYRIQTERQD